MPKHKVYISLLGMRSKAHNPSSRGMSEAAEGSPTNLGTGTVLCGSLYSAQYIMLQTKALYVRG